MAAKKRIETERQLLAKDLPPEYTIVPDEKDPFLWKATIPGTAGSGTAGQRLPVDVSFPADYPFKAPTFRFTSEVDHGIVDRNGNVFLDILESKWQPSVRVVEVLKTISGLLERPAQAHTTDDADDVGVDDVDAHGAPTNYPNYGNADDADDCDDGLPTPSRQQAYTTPNQRLSVHNSDGGTARRSSSDMAACADETEDT